MSGPARFLDQVVLVTGGGTGLGLEISGRLLSEGARAVVVASRNLAHHEQILAESQNHPGVVDSRQLDVRESDRVHELFQEVAKQYGRLDGVICNAVKARPT